MRPTLFNDALRSACFLTALMVICTTYVNAVAAPLAFIPNSAENTVSVIETSTNTVLPSIRGGNGPIGVAINSSGTRVFVTNFGDNSVSVISTSSQRVIATIPVGRTPLGVAINPAGTRVYVANRDTNTLSLIDTATNTVIGTKLVGNGPSGVGINRRELDSM